MSSNICGPYTLEVHLRGNSNVYRQHTSMFNGLKNTPESFSHKLFNYFIVLVKLHVHVAL